MGRRRKPWRRNDPAPAASSRHWPAVATDGPSRPHDVGALMAVYDKGREHGGHRRGTRVGDRTDSRRSGFPVPRRAGSAVGQRRACPSACPMSSSPPDCRSSCGAASPTTSCCDAAVAGRLSTPAGVSAQVKRMLADPRSSALVTNFVGQWLYLRNVRGHAPDPNLFPGFRRQSARGVQPRDRVVLRESAARGPAGHRPPARQLHVRQRAAGAALRHARRLRQPFPPGHPHRRSAAPVCWGRAAS